MKPILHTARLHFDQEHLDLVPDKFNSGEKLYVDFTLDHNGTDLQTTLSVHPKTPIALKGLELRFSIDYPASAKVWCSGLHPRRHAAEHLITDKSTSKGWLAPTPPTPWADPVVPISIPLFSWSYGYIKTGENDYLLIGSTNEETAFTHIGYDYVNQQLVIQKDIIDLELSHSFPLLELSILQGNRADVFKHYFDKFSNSQTSPGGEQLINSAYTGWMAHKARGTHSTDAIRRFLKIKKEKNIPADMILIGPGYEKSMGDWLYSNDQFPDGLPSLIQEIKEDGLKAGIAITPLLASPSSDLFQDHRDWLLKDDKQQLATFKLDGDQYHVLDVYHSGVIDYLQSFCYRIITQWGVDLLRVDHLSAAYAVERSHKTRAQVITDILKMFRGSCPNTLLWATGLPYITGWTMADYVATTSNTLGVWNKRFPFLHHDPVADITGAQLMSALGRFHASGKAGFSVIQLKEDKKWTILQQSTVLILTALLGKIHLLTDPVDEISEEAWAEWRMVTELKEAEVLNIFSLENGCFKINFKNKGGEFAGYFNLGNVTSKVDEIGLDLGVGEHVVLGSV